MGEPDKPGDAVNYLKNTVGGTPEDKKTIEQLRSENTDLKAKLAELEASQASLDSNTKTDNAVENTPAPEENVAEDVDTVIAAPADNSPAEQQSDPDTIPAAADPPSEQVPELMDTDGSAPAENTPASAESVDAAAPAPTEVAEEPEAAGGGDAKADD